MTPSRRASSVLNAAQREAVEATEGPLLIIAGPGSGKTHTLVERVVHLIGRGVAPEEILVSTFTEKAAAELVTRISNRLAEEGVRVNLNEMYVGTLHSICLRLLDDHRARTRLKRSYQVLDQFDQQYLLYQTLRDYEDVEGAEDLLGPAQASRWRRAAALASWVNLVSEEVLDTAALRAAGDGRVRALGALAERYQAALEDRNALDFSTIQLEAYRLLRDHDDVRAALHARLRYLMVDEYQDTNTVQEALVLLLAGHDPGGASASPNLCVVGDDDQGLYRFRGATIRNILEFPDHFGDGACRVVRLSTNYRSHPDVIRFYGRWMEGLDWTAGGRAFRYEKEIRPREGGFPEGPAVVRVAGGASEEGWHEEVLAFLRHLRD